MKKQPEYGDRNLDGDISDGNLGIWRMEPKTKGNTKGDDDACG
jgi:hypothetical protein